jgi:hypothetical protein
MGFLRQLMRTPEALDVRQRITGSDPGRISLGRGKHTHALDRTRRGVRRQLSEKLNAS